MFTRKELLESPEYWFEGEQNELYRQVIEYLEREKINQSELARRLKISKGRVSQILDGEYNYSLKKLIDICLKIGIVPQIKYSRLEDVIKQDSEKKTEIPYLNSFSKSTRLEEKSTSGGDGLQVIWREKININNGIKPISNYDIRQAI